MKYYKCLCENVYTCNNYTLLPIREQDIMHIKDWRNAQIAVLRQKEPLTEEGQKRYFETAVWPTFMMDRPPQILFSFLKNSVCIGYGGLVHINWEDRRGEVSFLLNPERVENKKVYREDFLAYLRLLKEVAYNDLQFNRLTGETYDLRPYHVSIMEEAGFRLEGRMKRHIYHNGIYVDSLIHGHLPEYDKGQIADDHQNSSDFNVLVTSVSRKVPLVQAAKAAMIKLGNRGSLIGGDSNEHCIARHFSDFFWHMPPLDSLTDETLLAELNSRQVACVIPTRDGELLFWSRRKQWLHEKGIEVMVSDEESVNQCLDKLLFYQKCTALGIPAIMTSENMSDIHAHSLVVKDRFGAGARHIGLQLSPEKALQHALTLGHPIFQPYIRGQEYSVDAYVDKSGHVKGVVCRTRDNVADGESQITTTVNDIALEAECAEYVKKLKLYGHVIIQLLRDDNGTVHIIECNSRFGGASTLGVSAGLDSFYWFLLESNGISLDKHPFEKTGMQLQQVRYPCDLIIKKS